MNLTLKGITNSSQVQCASEAGVNGYTFDLRPKSFNFIQLHKIQSICTEKFLTQINLLFDNEKDFVIKELARKLNEVGVSTSLEFINVSDLVFLEKLGEEYSLYFNSSLSLKKIKECSNIKKIILEHQTLEEFHQKGELFGFLITGPEASPAAQYLFCLTIVTLAALAAKNIVRGRLGRNWMAIRDMDIAAELIGIRPLQAKLSAFAVSSFFIGMAG